MNINMDWALIWTVVGTGATVVGLIYAFLRNFKTDINAHIDSINSRVDKLETEWKEERKDWKEERKRIDQRVTETNKRMDGVYNILLKKLENQS